MNIKITVTAAQHTLVKRNWSMVVPSYKNAVTAMDSALDGYNDGRGYPHYYLFADLAAAEQTYGAGEVADELAELLANGPALEMSGCNEQTYYQADAAGYEALANDYACEYDGDYTVDLEETDEPVSDEWAYPASRYF